MKDIIDNLQKEAERAKKRTIISLFTDQDNRVDSFSKEFGDFRLDFSKQNISASCWQLLLEYYAHAKIDEKVNELFAGKPVNVTENRPALHFALRAPLKSYLSETMPNKLESVHLQLKAMRRVVDKIRSNKWRGYSGKTITDIVNLGVGGSELGPLLVCDALHELSSNIERKINLHFVSSMDGTQISKLLEVLNPETTLFIISSKSFTTVDTFYNVNTALKWLSKSCSSEDLIRSHHFIGISANKSKMNQWGIKESNQLDFWDWVGGRFSLWSAIGLPIAIKYGMDTFYELLEGAYEMDLHFKNNKSASSLPTILALISFWNSSFLEITANAVLPYDGRLKLLPNYLSQLEMESNGKAVSIHGDDVKFKTCSIIWGELGPNAQHAFYQLLHQGTQDVSCDFISTVKRYHNGALCEKESVELYKQQNLALANCFAQSSVLAFGDVFSEDKAIEPHKKYKGNQPSSTMLLKELTPKTLGAMIALYEHKTYVLSCLWEINPFDQWGVELGKNISKKTLNAIQDPSLINMFDVSTKWLLSQVEEWNNSND